MSVAKCLGEIMATEYRERASIWGNVITEGSLTMLYAPRGSGKTFVLIKLLHSVGIGARFLKWHCGEFKGCLLNGEMPERSIKWRFLKTERSAPSSVVGDRIKVISYSDCGGMLWNISDPAFQRRYEDEFADCKLIVIDSLLTSSQPRDRWDDDVKQWLRIQPWLVQLRDAGKAVVLVHHTGKSGEQIGTSLRENIMDTMIKLKPVQPVGRGLAFEFTFTKNRDIYGEDIEPLYVEMIEGEDGIDYWNWSPLVDSQARQVFEMRKSGLTRKQVADQLGLSLFEAAKLFEQTEVSNDDF